MNNLFLKLVRKTTQQQPAKRVRSKTIDERSAIITIGNFGFISLFNFLKK